MTSRATMVALLPLVLAGCKTATSIRSEVSRCTITAVLGSSGTPIWPAAGQDRAGRVPGMPASLVVFDDLSMHVEFGGHMRIIDEHASASRRCFFCDSPLPVAVKRIEFDGHPDDLRAVRIDIVQERCRSFDERQGCTSRYPPEQLEGLFECSPS